MKLYLLIMVMTAADKPHKVDRTVFSAYRTMADCEKTRDFMNDDEPLVSNGKVYLIDFKCEVKDVD